MTEAKDNASPRNDRWIDRPKEKRAACDGKRPKSREETPKEGSDSARRYRTATICGRAAQSARVFEHFSMQISQAWQNCNTVPNTENIFLFQLVRLSQAMRTAEGRTICGFVIPFAAVEFARVTIVSAFQNAGR
jgi:hypothetical protein